MTSDNLRTSATHSMPRPVCLRVGRVHPLWETLAHRLPRDCAAYDYTIAGHQLTRYFACPTREDVRAFRKGPARFALLEDRPALFLLFAFGEAPPWSNAPYSIHLVPQERRELPPLPLGRDDRGLLNATLVDRTTGVILGLRAFSWSPGFTRVVHAAIRRQANLSFDPHDYSQAMARAYSRWPETSAMLRAVAVRTSGGA